mmetsp:Transcript_47452/g.146156  ORF Transcript_47452/g.146156 Transcript_47452/m.146156 type:complete len:236 (-) Transcript_47452:256-963(-)
MLAVGLRGLPFGGMAVVDIPVHARGRHAHPGELLHDSLLRYKPRGRSWMVEDVHHVQRWCIWGLLLHFRRGSAHPGCGHVRRLLRTCRYAFRGRPLEFQRDEARGRAFQADAQGSAEGHCDHLEEDDHLARAEGRGPLAPHHRRHRAGISDPWGRRQFVSALWWFRCGISHLHCHRPQLGGPGPRAVLLAGRPPRRGLLHNVLHDLGHVVASAGHIRAGSLVLGQADCQRHRLRR